ncbi:MAG: hypothetical protein ACXWC9_02400 [Pseudobdellovibrionaceae bacterium]
MIWLYAFLIGASQAGYLQIIGTSKLNLQKTSQGLLLSGEYQIENKGDEAARNVYPEINLDRFQWRGTPNLLQSGASYSWKVSQIISKDQLSLPDEGRFVVSIFNSYEDLNGYPFAIPAIELFSVNEKLEKSLPQLSLQIDALSSKQYSAQVSVTNPAKESLKLLPLYILPREMDLKTLEIPLEIPAGGELSTSFLFENRTGLVGSQYHAFLILRWIEHGQRQAAVASTGFKVEKPPRRQGGLVTQQSFWAWWLWGLSLGLIWMWVFWVRPLRKFSRGKSK